MEGQPVRRIAVMTSGGDAPGMNPCIRAVVRTALAHDIEVIGVIGGYDGLIKGNFKQLGARDVGGIIQRGGTILMTASSDAFLTSHGQREAIRQLNGAGIEGLIAIGGGGSIKGTQVLSEKGVKVIGIPASIDNDIPGTDMSIGVDTALNTIVDAIDKLRDTASSHNRAFIVETMGITSGYLALRAGVVCGAEITLIPEIDTPVKEVTDSVLNAYKRGKTHCIIVMAEGFHTGAAELAKEIESMNIGFDLRVTILGHVQRGGRPTAFDRWLATRYGVKAVELLIDGKSGVMTVLSGSEVIGIPVGDLHKYHKTTPEDYYRFSHFLSR